MAKLLQCNYNFFLDSTFTIDKHLVLLTFIHCHRFGILYHFTIKTSCRYRLHADITFSHHFPIFFNPCISPSSLHSWTHFYFASLCMNCRMHRWKVCQCYHFGSRRGIGILFGQWMCCLVSLWVLVLGWGIRDGLITTRMELIVLRGWIWLWL